MLFSQVECVGHDSTIYNGRSKLLVKEIGCEVRCAKKKQEKINGVETIDGCKMHKEGNRIVFVLHSFLSILYKMFRDGIIPGIG